MVFRDGSFPSVFIFFLLRRVWCFLSLFMAYTDGLPSVVVFLSVFLDFLVINLLIILAYLWNHLFNYFLIMFYGSDLTFMIEREIWEIYVCDAVNSEILSMRWRNPMIYVCWEWENIRDKKAYERWVGCSDWVLVYQEAHVLLVLYVCSYRGIMII